METSDSDYFESADEDVASGDDEQNYTVISTCKENLCERGKLPEECNVNEKQQASGVKSKETDASGKESESVINTDVMNKNENDKSTDVSSIRTTTKLNDKDKEMEKDQDKIDDKPCTLIAKEVKNLNEKVETITLDATESQHKNISQDNDCKEINKHELKTSIHNNAKKDNPVITSEKDKSFELKVDTNDEYDMWEHDEIEWNDVEEKPPKRTVYPEQSEINESAKCIGDGWDNEKWETIESSSSTCQDNENVNKSWGDWGSWGVTSLLSTATQGVSTLTSHVSQGLTTVLETGIGIPDPDELAKQHKIEKEKFAETIKESSYSEEDKSSNKSLGFGLGNFVSGVSHITKLVEATSNKVISGGLDTLETIGKKTMEVLQEGDPGLKKKRAYLKIDDRPVLSQLLREAKQKAEDENKKLEQKHFAKKANYEMLFDDHQGLVHLEALEMLSRQCDIKLQTLMETYVGDALTDMQETMAQVKELCEIVEEEEESISFDDVKERLKIAVTEINVPISYDKLISTWKETDEWLSNLNLNLCNEHELHQQAIEILAQLTAISVEQFHKMGELLLVKEHRSTADEADSLVQLTTTLTALIGLVATKFSDKLNLLASNLKNKEDVNCLITNVFYEAANSSSYIQDAFQLLIPVLQVGAI